MEMFKEADQILKTINKAPISRESVFQEPLPDKNPFSEEYIPDKQQSNLEPISYPGSLPEELLTDKKLEEPSQPDKKP